MRNLVRTAVAAVLFAFAGLAHAQDAGSTTAVDPARIAAARDLLEVTGVTKQLEGMMEAIKKGFAKGANAENTDAGKQITAEFDANMAKFMSYKEDMINDFATLYAETFTAEEMKTVADFYRSGTGAKFIALTPELMQKGSAIGMKYSQKVIEGMKAGGAPKP